MTPDKTPLHPVHAVLRRSRNLAADGVLVAGLPLMESAWREETLSVLIERHNESALARLVAGFDNYDQSMRDLLASRADGLSAGLGICLGHEKLEVRLCAISMIRQGGAYRLAYLLASALRNGCSKIAAAAAEALLDLATRVSGIGAGMEGVKSQVQCQQTPAQRGDVRAVADAVGRALASWRLHLRTEVVRAAAELSEHLEAKILSAIEHTRSRLAQPFNNLLEGHGDWRLAGFALRALRAPALRAQAIELLSTSRHDPFWIAFFEECWVLGDPEMRSNLRRVRFLGYCEYDVDILLGSSRRRVAQGVRLLSACSLGHVAKTAVLGHLIFSGDAAAVRTATWAAIDDRFEGSDELLQAVAARHGMALSGIARVELDRRGARVDGGPARPVRRVPDRLPWDSDRWDNTFDPYWEQFDSIAGEDRVAIGRIVADATPDFAQRLEEKLSGDLPADRRRAIAIVRELGLAAAFEQQLYDAVRDSDATLRCVVVTLLGALDTSMSRQLLRSAVNDPNTRVQANAIEALDRLNVEDKKERLIPKLASGDNRVRANAIKVLLGMQVRDAAEGLIRMLIGQSSQEKLSALWVVERLNLADLMERLTTLAQSDADDRVRRRAGRVLRGLGSAVPRVESVSGSTDQTTSSAGDLGSPEPAAADQERPTSETSEVVA